MLATLARGIGCVTRRPMAGSLGNCSSSSSSSGSSSSSSSRSVTGVAGWALLSVRAQAVCDAIEAETSALKCAVMKRTRSTTADESEGAQSPGTAAAAAAARAVHGR